MHARDFVASLAAGGRYHFTSADARKALGVSADAARLALNRLSHQTMVASPARGFYVVVPPEYQSLGCLPADQFIPALMDRLGLPYYAALLSAAQYHGAAHHRPQEFQVMLAKSRRPLKCGLIRVAFSVRKDLKDVAVQKFNTPRGSVAVSTPEATAIDLIGYHNHVGGLDQVATVLAELAEQIDPDKLVSAARTAPVAWAQRLGYLLNLVGQSDKTAPLCAYVKNAARDAVPLLPGASKDMASRDADWKLFVNVDVEEES